MALRQVNSAFLKIYSRSFYQNPLTRFLSTTSPDIATYEEVKKVPNNPKTILIDVREPQELVDTGIVPASINIPLGKVQEYLSGLSDSDFAKMFNRSKPTTDNELIFMCKIGVRSQKATDIARSLGYVKSRNYLGSWKEWSEKEGIVSK